MELAVRGRRDVSPLFIKLGVTFALSFTGFVLVQLRSRARARPPSPLASRPRFSSGSSSAHSPSRAESQAIDNSSVGLKGELRTPKSSSVSLLKEDSLAKIVNGTRRITTTTTTTTTTVLLSPTSGFLLSEFDDIVMKEFRATGKDAEIAANTSAPNKLEIKEDNAMEQEIANLRKLVWSLQENERSLELQLLEYYGMQEQEAAVRELGSQLKINLVEAKLYSLKIESLQADNRRLQDQLTECSRAMNELEAARATIKILKKKLKSDGEQAKEKIVSLHQRISVLQCQEQKEAKDERLKELEDEAVELKTINSRLAEENSDLGRQLEAARASASVALESSKADASEEANCLRESNAKLVEDIEQLKTDRCTDVEQLVYLKWVNACLRYELRNFQPPPGKTVARDLSKNLSPRSEEKAKQLILEYANSGADEKSLGSVDFDSEYSCSSQASTGEPEDASLDVSSSTRQRNPKKMKFLSKLKKLVLGKDTGSHKPPAADRIPITPTSGSSSGRRPSVFTCSIDDMIGGDSSGSFSSSITGELNPANQSGRIDAGADEQCQNDDAWSQASSRPSFFIQRLDLEEAGKEKDGCCGREVGTPYRYEKMVSREDTARDFGGGDIPEKAEIKKLAVALKRARGMSKLNRSLFLPQAYHLANTYVNSIHTITNIYFIDTKELNCE
ncbi:protein CHUP1, chloroplastic-like [Musa troglodytarum]|uniref:Protein CHUP1, chloroplastic-like n=1 Tax=Musa troglodytarum TaxID=320322 RepID=A0A9E7FPB7_9LILI|nr:protein CHUP1, chloroplastic-like [Musa troglodytarum]